MELNRIRKDQITPSQQQYVCSIPHGWPAGGARPATTTSRGCGWIVRPETGARTDTHVALPIHAMGAGRRIPYVRVLPGSPWAGTARYMSRVTARFPENTNKPRPRRGPALPTVDQRPCPTAVAVRVPGGWGVRARTTMMMDRTTLHATTRRRTVCHSYSI
jgi:hypothetical protein